jgi:hypothetical protein
MDETTNFSSCVKKATTHYATRSHSFREWLVEAQAEVSKTMYGY